MFNRQIVGLSAHNDSNVDLVIDAANIASKRYHSAASLVHHSEVPRSTPTSPKDKPCGRPKSWTARVPIATRPKEHHQPVRHCHNQVRPARPALSTVIRCRLADLVPEYRSLLEPASCSLDSKLSKRARLSRCRIPTKGIGIAEECLDSVTVRPVMACELGCVVKGDGLTPGDGRGQFPGERRRDGVRGIARR